MDVGVALPQMLPDVGRAEILAWCRAIDEGPFSSVSAGERITFVNNEMMVLLATAAAVTERVRVMANVCVTPWHRVPVIAKQLATIDVLSGGRLDVALGVGGRQQDYDAIGAPFARRHQRLDDDAAELRRIWAGGIVGDAPVGPPPVQPGGPPLLGSPMGPKSAARCAGWATGVSGFSLAADPADGARIFGLCDEAWAASGRSDRPRRVCGFFMVLGGDEPRERLAAFGRRYLDVFGTEVARLLAEAMPVHTSAALADALDGFEEIGCDEVILVPGTSDLACLDQAAEVVSSR